LGEGESELSRNFWKAQNCRKLLEETHQNFAKKPKDPLDQRNRLTLLPKWSCSREFAKNKESFCEISMVFVSVKTKNPKGCSLKIVQSCVVILESESPRAAKGY